MLSEGDIGRIAARIVAGCAPIALGIFGSYAVGHAHPGSNLDVFVIQHTRLPAAQRRAAALRPLFGVLHPVDVVVFTPAEFADGIQEKLSFVWVVARQARLYHWTEQAARLVPSLRAAAANFR